MIYEAAIDFYRLVGNDWLEIYGAVTCLLYVYLEIKQKASMWIVGFISSLVYVFVLFQSKVYGYAALYVYYVIVSVYGWYCWRYARRLNDVTKLQVSRLRLSLAFVLTSISAVLFIGIGYILNRTDSPFPFFDALGTSLSIVATWMVARKILEHWLLWVFVNFLSAVLFFYRGLYPTAGLFIVYGVLSVVGWIKWKQSFKMTQQ